MQRRDKIRFKELIDYWELRSKMLAAEDAGSAVVDEGPMSKTYSHCAKQLQKALDGESTEAEGFRPA